jgi:nucleoid DNA-binding protein
MNRNDNNSANALIAKFYESTKDKYGLTKDQIHDIVRTPFKLLHLVVEDMNNDISIRVMNLGTFKRSKRRVGQLIKATKITLANGNPDEDRVKITSNNLSLLQAAHERLKPDVRY